MNGQTIFFCFFFTVFVTRTLGAQDAFVQEIHPFLLPDSTLVVSYRLLPPPEGYHYDLDLKITLADHQVLTPPHAFPPPTGDRGYLYWARPPLEALRTSNKFSVEITATLCDSVEEEAFPADPWQSPTPRDYIFLTDQEFERNSSGERGLRIYTNDKTAVLSNELDYIEVKEDRIKGSPYLFDEPTEGALIDHLGDTYFPVLIKYNIFNHQIEYLREGRPVRFQPNVVTGFTIYDPEMIRQRHFRSGFPLAINERITPYSYLEVLHDGDLKVLRHYYKVPGRKVDPGVHNYVINEGEVVYSSRQESVFLLRAGHYEKVRFTRAGILNLFGDQQRAVREMVQREHLRFTAPDDFVLMVQYYEQLLGK